MALGGNKINTASRKTYAALDVESMGVDVNTGPAINLIDNRRSVLLINKNTLIFAIVGGLNNDLYAIPVKFNKSSSPPEKCNEIQEWDKKILPPGWEKHEDNDGPYYWHIKSGREMPSASEKQDKNFKERAVTRSSTSSALDLDADKRKEELALKRRTFPPKARARNQGKTYTICRKVFGLGGNCRR
ncbi:unnamed protein product [Ceutorhynchus assimilis]|uniref:WW domain-containing protein n=1 Tax=Ceutorhynchus assimilis TaxID=467358 RepID=A0A9N9MIK2_9CUCU|nr:unnamed protein product [Ceutorhynchus assimilis]